MAASGVPNVTDFRESIKNTLYGESDTDSSAHSSPRYLEGPNMPNDSFVSGGSPDKNSQAHAMEAVGGLDIRSQKHSLEQLKDMAPSMWNDSKARHVYKGFNVTRYIVENQFIFNPQLDQDFLLLTELLGGTNRGSEWLSVKEKLEEILGLFFVPGVEKMVNGLYDEKIFRRASLSLENQMKNGKYSQDETVNQAQHALKHSLIKFVTRVEDCYETNQSEEQDELKKGKREKKQVVKVKEDVFECYLERLFDTLTHLTRPENCPKLRKSAYSALQFTTKSFGKSLVSPRPDFAVVNFNEQVSAFVEVKPHYRQMFPLYRGHRMPGKRKRDAAQGKAQGEVMETAQTSFPTRDEEEEDDMDVSYSETWSEKEISEDQDMDNAFDEEETKIEAAKQEKLEQHIRRLEVKEKTQVRCFLPQLIAELMAGCNLKPDDTHKFLNNVYETKRFGIGVVGVKVRFVTMVIQDKSEKLRYPGPSDIENKNVSTKVYMTREMNLFKKSHLMMFFEIAYAMGQMGKTGWV